MSGSSTLDYREDQIKAVWHRQLPTWSSVLVCLTRRPPTSNSAPLQLDEPPVNFGYARVQYGVSAALWTLQNRTEVSNSGEVLFPAATSSWGLCSGWAILANITVPKTLAVGTLAEPLRVIAGVQPRLGPGTITWSAID
jgi:hypothetical protein